MIADRLKAHIACFEALAPMGETIGAAARKLHDILAAGGKILICGNGGSAADAQHFAAELVGRFQRERRALPAIALTVNTSTLTALANDYHFEAVFARQVQALADKRDIIVGLSTSGNSPNVIEALCCAKRKGLPTIAMIGNTGGALSPHADMLIAAPSNETARIQEVHLFVLHVWAEFIETRWIQKASRDGRLA